jgi:transposase
VSRAIRANRSQRFLLPPDIDEWVGPMHPVRFVAELVDELDLVGLGFEMSPGKEGRPHFAPELLLGVWLYGWMERIRSTRALEKAVHTQIAFLWLTGLEKPDHVTLWRFFDDNHAALRKLFKLTVKAAAKSGLVGFALHALDGTKLAAACSTETAEHRKALELELKKLDEVVDSAMAEVAHNERAKPPEWAMPESMKNAEVRRAEIRSALSSLEEAGAEHRHPQEPEARAVKTREGIRLGYNAQIVVDHDSDLVVAADVVTDATDHGQLVPMLENVVDILGEPAAETVADKGYWSGAQLLDAERRHLPVLVPAQEQGKKGPYTKSNFRFDAERNVYICPRGVELPLESANSATTGKPALRLYRCHDATCPERAKCTSDKKGRAIKRYDGEDAIVRQAAKLEKSGNRILWSLRKEIVEHVFGIVKVIDGFRRFTVRGLAKAKTQWSLACLALNLRKLLPAVHDGRLTVNAFR